MAEGYDTTIHELVEVGEGLTCFGGPLDTEIVRHPAPYMVFKYTPANQNGPMKYHVYARAEALMTAGRKDREPGWYYQGEEEYRIPMVTGVRV